MSSNELHRHVRRGDARRLRELLGARAPARRVDVNAYDENGFTPLMVAVKTAAVDANLVRLLLAHGADVAATSRCRYEADYPVLALALMSGDLHKVEALLEAGADLRYRRAHGYDALIDAVHGRDVVRDSRLLELLRVLIARGAVLDGVTSYHESALRVLSRLGRFDAVALLLEAGADASQLKWTPLMRAVALGSTGEVEALLAAGVPLEEVDFWSRTAWLIAIQTGDIGKAALLRERGASTSARGRCGMPPLFYAIGNHHAAMLRWLLDLGFGIEQTDDFGTTPLIAAVEADDAEGARMLLDAGATIDYERNGQTALSHARSPAIVSLLLDAGADPRFLSQEGRRTLLGFPGDADNDPLADIRADDFLRARTRRFGARNPEPMDEPFWHAMIRAGVTGYAATQWLKGPSSCGTTPVWCAQRFGQSLTFLPDGRIVQIGGEHEDYYDPDFCIYNDVFVHLPGGKICLFGYPETDFPPTDFHSATLIDDDIYVIGSLGYINARRYGETPVYRLDTRSFRFERVDASGDAPGWIYQHRAGKVSAHEIRITGGKVVTCSGGAEQYRDNDTAYVFDTRANMWRIERVR